MKIHFVHPEPLAREGLRSLLGREGSDWEVAGASRLDPPFPTAERVDFCLISYPSVDVPAIDAVPAVLETIAPSKLILYGAAVDHDVIVSALAAGVAGYILNISDPSIVHAALNLVREGGIYVPASVYMVPRSPFNGFAEAPSRTPDPPSRQHQSLLTDRQSEVLRCIGQGMSNRDIARTLGLAEGTVKIHVYNIFKALNVRNRVAATLAARRIGFE